MVADFSSLRLSGSELDELAPGKLSSYREARYLGGMWSASLEKDFNREERNILTRMYAGLKELMKLAEPGRSEDETQLSEFCRTTDLGTMAMELEQAGMAAGEMEDTVTLTILNEITRGPFASIYGILFLAQQGVVEPGFFSNLYYLARDQLKIMRSFVVDLDPGKRAEDEEIKHHSIRLLIEKWRGAVYRAFGNYLEVEFEADYTGEVAERCIEFAEVDRLFYHLANNAAQHRSQAALLIQVVETEDGGSLRWVFSNPLREEQYDLLQGMMMEERDIFEPGFSVKGKGLGLSLVAETVAHAYGLESRHQAVQGRYVGVKLDPHRFSIWFHWPKVIGNE